MMVSSNKRSYKVISLLIKTIILIFSFYYIWHKTNEANNAIDFKELMSHSYKTYLLVACCLMFVNWGLEALKWKLLIHPLESVSYLTSIQSIFAGVTISIFTPSRVGEFVGRIFFLEHADKIQATLKSFIGSIMQLLVT
ncbi:MAG: lysylphosphatidylglycerol synthase domain-containing protein, partial [Bacteroidota bacterium]